MNLWIRSQDRDILMKVDNLLIDDEKNHIYTHNYVNNMKMSYTLGRYKTKERALEVLDEIQKTIETHILGQVTTEWDAWYKSTVYEMPKE